MDENQQRFQRLMKATVPSTEPRKFILDATCGGRTIWFNKKNPNAVYIDIRKEDKGLCPERPNFEVQPDYQMDFRKMDFDDKVFKLVVWDPPHSTTFSKDSIMGKKYGPLNPQTYPRDLKEGFDECWRVLVLFYENTNRGKCMSSDCAFCGSPNTKSIGDANVFRCNDCRQTFVRDPQ